MSLMGEATTNKRKNVVTGVDIMVCNTTRFEDPCLDSAFLQHQGVKEAVDQTCAGGKLLGPRLEMSITRLDDSAERPFVYPEQLKDADKLHVA
jgi:hypothetical protein